MKDISVQVKVAITDIASQLDRKADIEEQIKKAMELAVDHWLVVDEQDRFKSAVGAVMIGIGEEERNIISDELKIMISLNAAITGIPVDFGRLAVEVRGKKSYGLNKMWSETKKKNE